MHLRAHFLCSAARLEQCPPDTGAEIAFAGRSNAGKSSVINALTGVAGLARASRTPGRTRLLNFFVFEEEEAARLVDLPGYGYARAAHREREQWTRLVENFLAQRRSLRGLVLVMDVRHPLKPGDREFLHTVERLRLPLHVLLNKADKPGGNELRHTERTVRRELEGEMCSVQLFSARKKTGVEAAAMRLRQWLHPVQTATAPASNRPAEPGEH